MQNIEISTDKYDTNSVEKWSRDLAAKYLPVTVILIMYLVLGILGNGTVLYIYIRKFKTYSKGRFLIPILAAVDLFSTVTNCAMQLVETVIPVMFKSNFGCKIVCFLGAGTAVEGTLTLVLVAVERYLKVCKPPGHQLSLKIKHRLIFAYTLFAILMGSPFLYYSGVTLIQKTETNVTGQICSMISGPMTIDAMVFGTAFVMTAILELLIMSVLYLKICRTLFVHRHFGMTSEKQMSVSFAKTSKVRDKVDSGIYIIVPDQCVVKPVKDKCTQQVSFRKGRTVSCSRLTIINIVITIIFAITTLPKVILNIIESTTSEFSASSPDNDLFIVFLSTFYIVNNIVNAYFFAFLDVKFQKELKRLLCPKGYTCRK